MTPSQLSSVIFECHSFSLSPTTRAHAHHTTAWKRDTAIHKALRCTAPFQQHDTDNGPSPSLCWAKRVEAGLRTTLTTGGAQGRSDPTAHNRNELRIDTQPDANGMRCMDERNRGSLRK